MGSDITVRGWTRSRRDVRGITLIELNDGSRFKSMQMVAGVACDQVLLFFAINLSATPLLHQRLPVGGGPSLKTWP